MWQRERMAQMRTAVRIAPLVDEVIAEQVVFPRVGSPRRAARVSALRMAQMRTAVRITQLLGGSVADRSLFLRWIAQASGTA